MGALKKNTDCADSDCSDSDGNFPCRTLWVEFPERLSLTIGAVWSVCEVGAK